MRALETILGVCSGFFAGLLVGIVVLLHAQHHPGGLLGRLLEGTDED